MGHTNLFLICLFRPSNLINSFSKLSDWFRLPVKNIHFVSSLFTQFSLQNNFNYFGLNWSLHFLNKNYLFALISWNPSPPLQIIRHWLWSIFIPLSVELSVNRCVCVYCVYIKKLVWSIFCFLPLPSPLLFPFVENRFELFTLIKLSLKSLQV